MEFSKDILNMLINCIERPEKGEINIDEIIVDIPARLQNKKMVEVKQTIQIIDANDNSKMTSYSYDKFIEIYDNYGLGGFIF